MGIGKIDPEYAVREGWARDSDDEIYMDGYNAFIQVTTRDGTSGFQVKNDIGAVAFSSKSDGDGYVAKNLGVGTYNPTAKLDVIGRAKTEEFQMLPGATDGYVLTTDSNGVGTWQLAPASDISISDPKGKVFNVSCQRSGNAGNKWMYHESSSSSTDDSPIHIAYDSNLVGISYMNANTGTDLDLEFYVNGTDSGNLVYTEQIRNAKRHGHTVAGSFFDMDEGDKLSVFIKRLAANDAPRHPVVELIFTIRTSTTTEFSAND